MYSSDMRVGDFTAACVSEVDMMTADEVVAER
jgi:hypothetical protein